MEKAKITKLWIMTNVKEITVEDFKDKTGFDFEDYFKENKKECLIAWRQYQKEGSLAIRIKKRNEKKGCICLKNNDDKSHEIVWHCKYHGNCWNGIRNSELLKSGKE